MAISASRNIVAGLAMPATMSNAVAQTAASVGVGKIPSGVLEHVIPLTSATRESVPTAAGLVVADTFSVWKAWISASYPVSAAYDRVRPQTASASKTISYGEVSASVARSSLDPM